jgi:hypothetical protein
VAVLPVWAETDSLFRLLPVVAVCDLPAPNLSLRYTSAAIFRSAYFNSSAVVGVVIFDSPLITYFDGLSTFSTNMSVCPGCSVAPPPVLRVIGKLGFHWNPGQALSAAYIQGERPPD